MSAKGLFYGGGFTQLGTQAIGIAAIAVWTAVTMTGIFFLIKKTNGLRVSAEEEIQGLDLPEHGLVSSYADFMITVPAIDIGAAVLPKSADARVRRRGKPVGQ